MDEKYVVFKRSEFRNWVDKYVPDQDHIEPVLDAVVIRQQDQFAPPALDAYSSNMLSVVEGLKAMDPDHTNDNSNRIIVELTDIATYFHQKAEESWHMQRKLPD